MVCASLWSDGAGAVAAAVLHGALVACGGGLPEDTEGVRRPNIVLVLSDDQDYEHFGFLGSERAKTPNLDRLADEGVLFTTAHVPAARCRPSHAALLTGRWPHQTGICNNVGPGRVDPERALPMLMRRGGYATFGGGKFWEGHPREVGFQRHAFGNPEDPENNLRFVREGQDGLGAFLDEFAGQKPLFIWWAPVLPHTPHRPPERFQQQIDRAAIPIPEWFAGDAKEFRMREFRSLAMVAWFDAGVGELRARLASADALADTLFVFLVDNGWSNGLVSKGSAFEKGVRTPLIFSWPDRLAEVRLEGLVSTMDVYPTVLDFAQIPIPDGTAGRSLRSVLEEREALPRQLLFGAAYPWKSTRDEPDPAEEVFAIYARDERWKYVLYLRDVQPEDYETAGVELQVAAERIGLRAQLARPVLRRRGHADLYDLKSDPYELVDLSGVPEHAARMTELRTRALTWWRETGGTPLNLP